MKAMLFCLCAFSFVCCEAVYKRWLLDTNFENPQNWNVKRAPCGNDVVILPDDSPVVYMQMNTTIKELVLPSTGELILGNSVSLGFTASPSSGCPDAKGDVEFTAVHPGPWMNPKDWCATSTERGTCDKSPRLEVENVPCRYDDVIFPRNRAYFVDLSELDSNTTVKSLKLIGSSLTTASFASFVNSSDGQRMFRRGKTAGPVLQISRQACDDQGGCACGNDRPEITKKICAYVNKNCARPRCSNSILPTGMCCRSCGASLKITKGYGFVLDEFKSTLKKEFFNNTSGVSPIVAVMSGNWVQLLLSDTTGEKSVKLAADIKAAVEKDIAKGGHKYKVDRCELALASKGPPPLAGHTGSSLSGGSIAGIIFGIIIALIIIAFIVVVFVYRRNGRPLPTLPTLPNMPRIPGLRILNGRRVTSRDSSVPKTASHVDPGFANPMYDTAPIDDDFTMKEMDVVGSIKYDQPTFDSSGPGFQNPLYANTGTSHFKDPSKADTPGDEATTSGIAATPTSGSGASPGPKATTTAESSSNSNEQPATGILLDFATDSQGTDSTI